MEFYQILNETIEKIGCTNKEISSVCGLSPETISRYRKGIRSPQYNSKQLDSLVQGIVLLSERNDTPLSADILLSQFRTALGSGLKIDYISFCDNLRNLMEQLNVSNSDLARYTNFDPSYISRIISGKRKPSDLRKFSEDTADYFSRMTEDLSLQRKIGEILAVSVEELADKEVRQKMILHWMNAHRPENKQPIDRFLSKLDEFNLDEYIHAIHFDTIRIPTTPFQFPSSKKYHGLKEMEACEIDFIKATVLSKSTQDVISYSDMPMEEMSKDEDFAKRWMFGTAMILKKGLQMRMIHNVNRPFHEMMLGLESYIPMYMTGQITPYYLKNNQGEVFHHLLKVSGSAAMTGEAIAGYHEEGRYYLTNNKDEMKYYRMRAQQLLSHAEPLMEIYNSSRSASFMQFFQSSFSVSATRQCQLSTLPLYTLSEELALSILQKNHVPQEDRTKILQFISLYQERMEQLLTNNEVFVEYPTPDRETLSQPPLSLALSGIFHETDIFYDADDYLAHLQLTEQFEARHPHFHIEHHNSPVFRNINITIIEGQYVIVSKNKSPAIHFIIRHPRIMKAFENFYLPISDEM